MSVDTEAPPAGSPRSKRPLSVLVVIVTAAGEYLVMNRVRPAGFWQAVTGSLKPGESARSAALREVREETGLIGTAGLIDLHQSRLFPIIPAWRARYAPGACFNREYWFVLWLPGRRLIRLDPAEHSDYAWLALPAALHRVWSWTNRDAMRLWAARAGGLGHVAQLPYTDADPVQ